MSSLHHYRYGCDPDSITLVRATAMTASALSTTPAETAQRLIVWRRLYLQPGWYWFDKLKMGIKLTGVGATCSAVKFAVYKTAADSVMGAADITADIVLDCGALYHANRVPILNSAAITDGISILDTEFANFGLRVWTGSWYWQCIALEKPATPGQNTSIGVIADTNMGLGSGGPEDYYLIDAEADAAGTAMPIQIEDATGSNGTSSSLAISLGFWTTPDKSCEFTPTTAGGPGYAFVASPIWVPQCDSGGSMYMKFSNIKTKTAGSGSFQCYGINALSCIGVAEQPWVMQAEVYPGNTYTSDSVGSNFVARGAVAIFRLLGDTTYMDFDWPENWLDTHRYELSCVISDCYEGTGEYQYTVKNVTLGTNLTGIPAGRERLPDAVGCMGSPHDGNVTVEYGGLAESTPNTSSAYRWRRFE